MPTIRESMLADCPAVQAPYGEQPVHVQYFNEVVVARSKCTLKAVCVADHCYNSHNSGNSVHLAKPKYFLRKSHDTYVYVGPDYPYTGPIYHKAKGAKVAVVIGHRVKGKLV